MWSAQVVVKGQLLCSSARVRLGVGTGVQYAHTPTFDEMTERWEQADTAGAEQVHA